MTMDVARRNGSLVAALLLACTFAPPARASVVMALSFDELAAQANRVVLGNVESVQARWSADGERIETVVELAVELELSNASGGATVRIVQPGGTIGDVGLRVSGMPEFKQGERVLVFLEILGPDTDEVTMHRVLGLAQGKLNVLPRIGGGFDVLQRIPMGLALAEPDADGMIRPNEQLRPLVLDLDEALARIRLVRGEVTP
jgi:hypothetical protein